MEIAIILFLLTILQTSSAEICEEFVGDTNDVENDIIPNYEYLLTAGTGKNCVRSRKLKLMKNLIDTSVNPCDDFYQYACGNFNKYFPIPEDKSEYNFFKILNNNIAASLEILLNTKLDNEIEEPNAIDKAKLFFASCMDIEMRNNKGITPLRNLLNEYGNWPIFNESWSDNEFDWIESIANIADLDMGSLLEIAVYADLNDPRYMSIQLTESEYGLKNKENYKTEGKELLAYQSLIEEIFSFLNVTEENAKQVAKDIIKFEKNLSSVNGGPLKRANYTRMFGPVTLKTMIELFPDINWKKYLEISFGNPISLNQSLSASITTYYDHLVHVINQTEPKIVANYIAWRIILNFIEYLDENSVMAYYKMEKIIKGKKGKQAQWRTCVRQTNEMMDMPVAALFVQSYFDEASKDDVIQITEELKIAFLQTLQKIDWLDDKTKAEAEKKARRIIIEPGYPKNIGLIDKMNEYYENLYIQKNNYFENVIAAIRNKRRHNFNKLYEKFDPDFWTSSPVVVNAYFDQTQGAVLVPAASLQPPFYHLYYPKVLNYAGMGFFIGHEITHGFDNFGREFNSAGIMTPWWSDDSIQKFEEQTLCFVLQYSNFSLDGNFLEGFTSKGENIADNGGVRQAYYAYNNWLEKNNDKDDWTNEEFNYLNMSNSQIFFLQFAQNWCEHIRPEAISNTINSDHHCPGKYRVNGALMNFERFAESFNCSPGSNMNPLFQCRIW